MPIDRAAEVPQRILQPANATSSSRLTHKPFHWPVSWVSWSAAASSTGGPDPPPCSSPSCLLTLALIGLYALGTHQGVVLAAHRAVRIRGGAGPLHLPGPSLGRGPRQHRRGLSMVPPRRTTSALRPGALIGGLLLPHTGVRSTYLTGAVLTALAPSPYSPAPTSLSARHAPNHQGPGLFDVPPPDFKIRCATHLMHRR